MADSPGIFAIFYYLFSTLLDEFDGYFSRKLNQSKLIYVKLWIKTYITE
jgi:hypothetical protein